jgi:nidogen (entactin)
MFVTVVTSSSSRSFSLTSGSINQTWSYHIDQNITYQACRHAPRHLAIPATQQLTVDRAFALYSEDEGVLRFAVTNQIGPVEGMYLILLRKKKKKRKKSCPFLEALDQVWGE